MKRPDSSFSEDPEDAPIEADPREAEAEEDEPETPAAPTEQKDQVEGADEVELKLAFPELVTLEDVSDIHHDRKGKVDGFELSTTKAAHTFARKMRIAMEANSEFIYWFNGEIYKPDGMRLADMKLCKLVGDEETVVKMREVERRMKNVLRSSLITFEPNPYLLAVQNGVIDLSTGEFREFRQEDYLLEKLDVVYDPAARCPVFCGFMETVTNQALDRLTLIDWLACHAIKIPLPYVMFLLGLGRNGKGLYERLMKAFYGHAAFRDFAIDAPARNNFAASKLFRKRGWIAAETNTTEKETVIGTELFKLISGNGAIDGDVKYSIEGLHFEPYTQITVDTNGMPRFKDRSIGWEERIVTMNLPYLFKEKLEKDNPLVKVANPDLYDKLTSPSELSGILNLIIDRAKLICKTKRITKRSGSAMLKGYGEQSNSVTTFLNTFCEYTTLSSQLAEFAPIYEAFETWCQLTVSEKVDSGYFGKLLKKFCGGMEPKLEKKTVGKKRVQVKYYRGLVFDDVTYKATIEKLQAGFKVENVYSVHTEDIEESTEKKDSLLSMSIVSIEDQWKVIIDKYSVSFIGGFMPQKGVDTISTMDTDNKRPQKTGIEENIGNLDSGNAMDTSGNQPGGSKLVGSSSSEEPGKCTDASIPDESTLAPAESKVDPERAAFHEAVRQHATKQQKRTCYICGHESDHDLNQDLSNKDYPNAHICADCHISHRTKSKVQAEVPAAPSPQTSLSDVVPTT